MVKKTIHPHETNAVVISSCYFLGKLVESCFANLITRQEKDVCLQYTLLQILCTRAVFVTCVVVVIVTNMESQHVLLRNIASTHDECANAPVGSAESTRR